MTLTLRYAVLLIVLTACTTAAPADSPTPEPPATPTPVPAVSAECAAKLQPLLDALQELDGRLDVGLTKVDYSERVGDVSVAYSRLDAEDLAADPGCLPTATKLEQAFNEYQLANNRWSECLGRTGCETDDIESQLQGHWRSASERIDEASAALP